MIWDENQQVGYSLRAESVRRECEASLRRLRVEVIDLYQIHWTAEELNETVEGWETLAALQKEGKVRWIGVSNASVEEMEKLHAIAPITSLQPHYCGATSKIRSFRGAGNTESGPSFTRPWAPGC